MTALTKEQLKAIEELSNTVINTRSQLAEGLCEVLGDNWTWGNGFVNGHGNSIVLYCDNTIVQFATYQFRNPKSVSIKLLIYGDYMYFFDKYGKVKKANKSHEIIEIKDGVHYISYKYEDII